MFWAIFLTVVITSLIFLVLSFRRGYLDEKEECRTLRNANANLRKELNENRDNEAERRVRRAYNQGLYDGRETDRAYREILRKTKNGDYDDVAFDYLRREKAGVRK